MIYLSRHTEPLTEEQIRRLAPSVYAEAAHSSRSGRYTYLPTADILTGLVKEDFEVVSARQSRPRDLSRRAFTKHILRLRHRSRRRLLIGETFPEIVIVNSHDGTSAYQIMGGLFRLDCLNNIVVSEGKCEKVKVPHKGDMIDRVIEGSYRVLGHSVDALQAVGEWRAIDLDRRERMAFAEAARALRFADEDGAVDSPIQPEQLLEVRRPADQGSDLWHVFNRTQEAVIRGGMSASDPETGRRVTAREVKAIDGDIKLNRALFDLAERMAALKAA